MNGLSLFSNVGIGEFYLDNSRINIKVANELLEDRAEFYRKLHPQSEMISGDITNTDVFNNIISRAKEHAVDYIMATPPCQGMSIQSLIGRNSIEDPRNSLIIKVIEAVQILQPQFVLIENVTKMENTSILYKGNINTIKTVLINEFKDQYNITFNKLDAANYDTPQYRKRLFVLMAKKPLTWNAPIPSKTLITVENAIGHLPTLETDSKSGIPWHFIRKLNENHVKWMKHTPTGKSAYSNDDFNYQPTTIDKNTKEVRLIKGFDTAYKRMKWDEPAPTITMYSGSISSQCNVHPGRKNGEEWTDARPLSIREISILCGLSEDWLDGYCEQYSEEFFRDVIGECVAPKIIRKIIDNIPEVKEVSVFEELYK